MRADRNKRAVILQAEGQRESAIKTAEGQKAAQILSAEGQKQSAILSAEADRQARILRAEGERAARFLAAQGQAKAIETTFGAIHAAKPDPALLAYQYLQILPQIAQGDANKMWIVPSEFSKALEGLARLAGGDSEGEEKPSWLAATSTGGPNGGGAPELDTSRWFDSNLPPAAEQPEAMNLRASDDDLETREAHTGLVSPNLRMTEMPPSTARPEEAASDSAAAHAAQQPPPYMQPPPPSG